MYQFQPPLQIEDFSGGKTDNYIDCKPSQGKEFDNLLIGKDKKPFSRFGTLIYNSSAYQIPAGNARISAVFKHPQSELFFQSARNIYYISSNTFQTLQGPVNSNAAFSAGAVTNFISWAEWKNHLYFANDSFADPIKVYKDSGGTFRVRTAGLPRIDLEGAIDLANDLKAKYNAHIADASEHTAGVDAVNGVSSANAHDFDTLVTLVTELLTDYDAHEGDAELASSWLYHAAQEAADRSLASLVAPTTVDECITRLVDFKAKFNAHDADGTAHGTDSLHQSSVSYVPTVTGSGSTNTYLYKFLYYFTYTVGDVEFQNFGPTTDVTLVSNAPGTFSIAQIPAISNGSTRCYDTATIKIKIYRTVAAGTVYYYVGEVTNGTTTYSDTTTDANLILSTTLYTNGGALDNDPPPRAKFVHTVNDVTYWCNVKEGTKNYPNKFRPSKPGSPDSCPEENGEEVEADITGISSVGIYPIVFCRERCYRLEGIIDELGRGSIEKREISRTKGCISNLGIVQIPQGLVFPGPDGFYFTDGYQVQPISIHLIETYKSLISSATQEKRIYGRYDSSENRVYWGVKLDSGSSDNDGFFVLDLNYPLSSESVFTTISNTSSWSPACFEFYSSTFVIGDRRGYAFKFDENTFTDLVVDTNSAPSTWATATIRYDYTSFATTFGGGANIKFVPSITLQAKNRTNTTIQVSSNNDDSGVFRNLKEIRFRGNITWGDASIVWNDTSQNYPWRLFRIVKAFRRFPHSSLRSVYKQIKITNAYTIIYNSDTVGTATVSGSGNTATISGTWPTDVVGYFISFSNSSYTVDFEITTRNSATVLTFADTNNVAPTGTYSWVIKGYKKGETLKLLSYSLDWALVGQRQDSYRGDTGGNAS